MDVPRYLPGVVTVATLPMSCTTAHPTEMPNDNNHPPLARAGATGIQQRSCWTVGCIDGLGDDLRTTEHRFDIVSVWIQHKGRVITRVILLPQSRCAV